MSNVPANTNGGFVQSNSVTSQFNSLSVDRENFRNAKKAAQSSYEKVQQAIRQLKQEQASLLTLIRTEQEVLGTLTRKRDMFGTEKARLLRVMDSERKALETCAKHTRSLAEAADKAAWKYANDMGEASSEVAGYLQSEVRAGMISLISVDSIQAVVVPKLPKDPQIQKAFHESFQLLINGKQALEEQVARHSMLHTKSEAVTSQSHEDPADLFYGHGHDMDAEVSTT